MKTVIISIMTMIMATCTVYGQETPPPIPSDEQPEVLTSGPIHEAFAQPVNLEEDNGFIVPKAPPPDIEETPPAERPVGDQFAWIPGYWAWDSDRNEHIWVSGCWRAVPQGKYWVPGYWVKVTNGWKWVAGFWASVEDEDIEYLPAPPAVTYIDPPSEPANKIWVPACWYWSYGRYTLRSGYWIDARENWVWVPSHYVWTPRGYIFVRGYWDYPFLGRGVLFAPVYFPGHIYRGVRFSYSLSIVVDLGNLEFGFFTRPSYRHYYFGDYYDSFYVGLGIFPWFDCVYRKTWYDPLYLHDRWRHRRNRSDWWQHERREYERRRADRNLRPPKTYREMERRIRNMPESRRRSYEVASPLRRVVEKRTTKFRFRQDKPEARSQITRHTNDVYRYTRDRRQWETSVSDRKASRAVRESAPPKVRSETRATVKRKSTDSKQSQRREYSQPERVRSNQVFTTTRSRDSSKTTYRQERPSNTSERREVRVEPNNVKARTSPVVNNKKGGIFRRRPPSQPSAERAKTEKAEKQDNRKTRDSRGRRTNRR